MNGRAVILRETLVSMAINGLISGGLFFLISGFDEPVRLRTFGFDFLPQAFMVALMASLIPALLVGRRSGAPIGSVARRSAITAVAALSIAGGGAFLICGAATGATIAPAIGLAIKVTFGMLLAAVITPFAVRAALDPEYR